MTQIYQNTDMTDYKQIIIDGYIVKQSNGTAYKSYFKEFAQIYKRDNFKEFSDFFACCKRAIIEMKQSIENYCNIKIEFLNSSILYWKNFIPDIIEWENHLRALGIIVNDNDRKKHQEENGVDIPTKIQELEKEKENWQYERHGYVYEHAESIYGHDKEIPYNELLKIEQARVEAMQELGVEVQLAAMPGIAKKLSKWITGATDWVLSEIIINKKLPEGATKPKWIGTTVEAFDFLDWCKMDYPKDFHRCFGGIELKIGNKPKEGRTPRAGTIWYTLQEINKP